MIRNLIVLPGIATVIVGLTAGAGAQVVVNAPIGSPGIAVSGESVPAGGITYSSAYVPPAVATFGTFAVATSPAVYVQRVVPPYSYFAAEPLPAREYVSGFGANNFPFYGQPYGHPYDRWSWGYLSGTSRLDRYYYPPVR